MGGAIQKEIIRDTPLDDRHFVALDLEKTFVGASAKKEVLELRLPKIGEMNAMAQNVLYSIVIEQDPFRG